MMLYQVTPCGTNCPCTRKTSVDAHIAFLDTFATRDLAKVSFYPAP